MLIFINAKYPVMSVFERLRLKEERRCT